MEPLLIHCGQAFDGHGSLFAVFFMGGLTGSLTHCLAMCGPIVACQAACGNACGTRLGTASQWQYHLGRFLIYGLLGFASSAFAMMLSAYSFWPALTTGMLIIAGLLFVLSGVFPKQHRLFFTSRHAFLRGALMGFMPCGLLYAALMITATLTNPFSAMIAMWCFVLGTLPALLLASGSMHWLAQRWQRVIGHIGRIGLTLNGLTLLAMAAKLTR